MAYFVRDRTISPQYKKIEGGKDYWGTGDMQILVLMLPGCFGGDPTAITSPKHPPCRTRDRHFDENCPHFDPKSQKRNTNYIARSSYNYILQLQLRENFNYNYTALAKNPTTTTSG